MELLEVGGNTATHDSIRARMKEPLLHRMPTRLFDESRYGLVGSEDSTEMLGSARESKIVTNGTKFQNRFPDEHQDLIRKRFENHNAVFSRRRLLLLDLRVRQQIGFDGFAVLLLLLSLANFLVGLPILSLAIGGAIVDQSTTRTLFGASFATDVALRFDLLGLWFGEAVLIRCLVGDFRRDTRVGVVFRIVCHRVGLV